MATEAPASYGKSHAEVTDARQSAMRRYQRVVVGSTSLGALIKYELLTSLLGGLPGALGLFLRARLYRSLFRQAGRGLVVGRNVSLLHPSKIALGDNVVIADGATLDARGYGNRGITVGDDVVVGRGAMLICKDGDIHVGCGTQFSESVLVSAVHGSRIEIGDYVVIGAFTYIGGGRYRTDRLDVPIALQGNEPVAGARVGDHVWLGARVIVLDGTVIGRDAIVGAGAVVTRDIPPYAVAVGTPARVIRLRADGAAGGAGA